MFTYEFDKCLISVRSNIALGVNNFTERFPQFNEFLLCALPWQVPQMKNLGWGLCIAELWLTRHRCHAALYPQPIGE